MDLRGNLIYEDVQRKSDQLLYTVGIEPTQRMPKSWERVGTNQNNMIMRTERSNSGKAMRLAPLLAVMLLAACEKEVTTPTPQGDPQGSVGRAKTFGRYFETVNNSGFVPNITVNVYDLCRNTLATHRSAATGIRTFNTTTCSNPNFGVPQTVAGTYCYQSGVWYYLGSTSGPSNKRFMKFKLGPLYDDMATYVPLFRYNTSTGRWTCPGQPVSDPDFVQWQEITSLPTPC